MSATGNRSGGEVRAQSPSVSHEARLAVLVQLEQRIRSCQTEDALLFLLVNDAHALAPYRQALVWQGGARPCVRVLSGLATVDAHAPFNVWLSALLAHHAALAQEPGPLVAPPQEAAMWAEHLPAHAWWIPMHAPAGAAGLLLLREAPWQPGEVALLALLASACSHAWGALPSATVGRWWAWPAWSQKRRRLWAAGAVALGLVLALPVRQTVLAPAEVVARAPLAVRAPLQGVVDRVYVQPNQQVQTGALLVALDARELEGRLEAARQALAVSSAELRQGQQQALFDARSKAGLGIQQGRNDQSAAEVDYLERALARTRLLADRAGTVIFDDASDWVGKPVALGERIMQLADPQDVELEVQLPVSDAIALPDKAPVRLFLNTAPASPLTAELLRVAYRAAPGADGTLAYRVRAAFTPEQEVPRIGLKGTARLSGERTLLIVYLLRRPLASVRVWLGV